MNADSHRGHHHSCSQATSGTTSLPSERLTRPIFSIGLGIAIRPKDWQPSSLRRSADDGAAGTNAAKKKLFYTIVKADLLIPGDGDPLEDAVLVIEGSERLVFGT
ncbi:hypothetical protein PG994_010740 [Apiospora phragmitis]|uniref:Uncharacterized protein n=1 Tax=Apiospora phragmitis TaxID=2905665 RepID=A0ABR1TT33_9PEZI